MVTRKVNTNAHSMQVSQPFLQVNHSKIG